LRVLDRLRLAFAPKNGIMELLQRYADDYLQGKDVPTRSGIGKVDAETAMRYSAVFACNRVLAETLASCPVFLYEVRPDGNREKVTNNTLYEIMHYQPNPDMTPTAFKESGVSNINFGGNFFAQKVRNTYGDLVQLRPVMWDRVRMKTDETTGSILYFVDGADTPRTRETILHIPGMTIDGYFGITPLEFAQTTLKVGIYQEAFQQNFYQNGVMSSGVFKYPNELSDPAFQRLKKDLKENYAGLKNAGVPMILEGGGDFKELTMKLTDAQFLESKRFQIEDICRFYRVPLHLVQDLSRSTNNNIEHQSLEFIIYTMLPWFKRWEENLNLQLLTRDDRRRGRYFEFKIDSLLRGDAAARATAYATGRQWGWLSVNDILKLENMNPIPNGDIYLQPSNMFEAGKEPQANAAYARLVEDIYQMISERGNVA
jgi:HK97 family phage portal protein